jgi:hypothetical protein
MDGVAHPPGRSWSALLRLWFLLAFSYVLLKQAFNLAIVGWIDLRRVALWEMLLLPLGQALVFWFVTHRRGASGPR